MRCFHTLMDTTLLSAIFRRALSASLVPVCGEFPIPLSCFDAAIPMGGDIPSDTCASLCGVQYASCSIMSGDLQCSIGCPTGRAYEGMDRPGSLEGTPLQRHYAETAYLEAAAVDAFLILAGELEAHGAPRALRKRAKIAARDEARHWRMTRRLARRYGPCKKPERAAKRPVRDLAAIALENAAEGCVRETYGALVAHHQAERASDPEVRALMKAIADDETRHAALAWEIARWVEPRLSAAARVRIRRATEAALGALRCEIESMSPALAGELGLPAGRAGAALVDSFRASLF